MFASFDFLYNKLVGGAVLLPSQWVIEEFYHASASFRPPRVQSHPTLIPNHADLSCIPKTCLFETIVL